MTKITPLAERLYTSIVPSSYGADEAFAVKVLDTFIEQQFFVRINGTHYLERLTDLVMLQKPEDLGCSHDEMLSHLLPWLEPAIPAGLTALARLEEARRKAMSAA